MRWIARLAARMGFTSTPRARRSFEAAAVNRLTASWLTTAASIDQELRGDLDRLRARSRDLAKNNDYAAKFLAMVVANVVGPQGFVLQSRVYDGPGRPDEAATRAIEDAFTRWARLGVCEVTGRMGFADLQRAVVRAAARDGEFLVRKIRGASAGNPFGFALQLLDVERLDTRYNLAPGPGRNAVIMGVEVDRFRRPVAYHLFESHPGEGYAGSRRRMRVPADEILHGYIVEMPEQTRGIPWMHAAIMRLHHLKGYEEAAIIAARVGAAKMGFFTAPDGDAGPISDGKDAEEIPYTEADPGTFGVLPKGYQFQSFDPDYPHAQYEMFVKACLRGIASGLNVAYTALANDLEKVSFSSVRAGVLEERDHWMLLQQWFAEAFLTPVFEEWLALALLAGEIRTASGAALPAAKLDKFRPHEWQGRRWQWVDPLKDIQAARLGVQSGIVSPQMIAAQNGVDVEDVLRDIAAFEAMRASLKVTLVGYDGAKAPVASSPNEANAEKV